MSSATKPASDWKSTACILCECNCGIEVELGGPEGRNFVRVRGDDAHPVSQGYACEKASRVEFYQNGPHRLTKPLRRRADGSFEEIDWETAIREVAQRFAAIRDQYGGDSIFYYGGGGQGNHLPGAYGRATRAVLGSRYRSSALAQEKTGEFWVASRMFGGYVRGDFEHCEAALLIGKNPWQSHGIPRARVTLRAIARDPQRTLIVIDPVLTETAELADMHLRVRPGGDAFLLAAMIGVIVQEGLVADPWLALHADGLAEVLPHFAKLPVAEYCGKSGVPEDLVRRAARRIAEAGSVASFEDLGVQMNRHSTLVSYLHKLLIVLTGHFGKKGAAYRPTALVPLMTGGDGGGAHKSPVTGARVIGGLVPCNVIPDEILTDHPKRFRALLVESGNPAHSLADGPRMRQALAALDLVVVIDVAMSETARLAHYVLPVASQYEKAEATFFNFEFPRNYFHLRKALLAPLPGLLPEAELHARLVDALGALPHDAIAALRSAWQAGRAAFRAKFFELSGAEPRLAAVAPVVLYRAIGDLLPEGLGEAAALWGVCQLAAQRQAKSMQRAGFAGRPFEAADALFDALLLGPSAVNFSTDDWDESFARIETANRRIQLAIPELFDELDALGSEPAPAPSAEFPFVLSAGERRSYTANTIIRDPQWRRKDMEGALRMNPDDARRVGVVHGGRARITTQRGTAEVAVELSERMLPGHVSLPNGLGLDFPNEQGEAVTTGVSLNELTRGADRDWLAGTPWHKHTPARVETA
ncbi:MAG: molybdopterin-dependent oxidoreductase [Burkholderiales bacterium]|jgi:anaerobic selenocysteine-containing dehydrogenase|nr:molybdopterin-dependent oxidoreductase [Burkholderiales bacterium]